MFHLNKSISIKQSWDWHSYLCNHKYNICWCFRGFVFVRPSQLILCSTAVRPRLLSLGLIWTSYLSVTCERTIYDYSNHQRPKTFLYYHLFSVYYCIFLVPALWRSVCSTADAVGFPDLRQHISMWSLYYITSSYGIGYLSFQSNVPIGWIPFRLNWQLDYIKYNVCIFFW